MTLLENYNTYWLDDSHENPMLRLTDKPFKTIYVKFLLEEVAQRKVVRIHLRREQPSFKVP